MLKISYAACPCLSQLISAQFTLEICLAAWNRRKIYKTLIFAFKVIEFGVNREPPVYDLLLVTNCNLGHILHRYWDTATYWPKIANFAHPPLIYCPCSGWPLSNLWKSFTAVETRVFHAADGEDLVILACTVFDWSCRVTDGQTDRIVMAKTR